MAEIFDTSKRCFQISEAVDTEILIEMKYQPDPAHAIECHLFSRFADRSFVKPGEIRYGYLFFSKYLINEVWISNENPVHIDLSCA